MYLEVLFIWVLNFVLFACDYSYQFTDPSIFLGSAIEAHARVEHCFRENSVLSPEETLKSFFERAGVQQAFQEASITLQLRREDRNRLVRIMTEQ